MPKIPGGREQGYWGETYDLTLPNPDIAIAGEARALRRHPIPWSGYGVDSTRGGVILKQFIDTLSMSG